METFPTADPIAEFEQALLRADKVDAEAVLRRVAESPSGLDVEGVVLTALERIGREWEAGNVALAQIYLGGRICEDLVSAMLPDGASAARIPGRCAIVLLNDHHLLGKRIVLSALRSAGFDIRDWGRMTPDEVVARTLDEEVEVLLVSTLMLASALEVETLRKRLDAGNFGGKLLVGGAPFRLDKRLWKEVGADATADNAMASAKALAALLGRRT